MQLADILKLDLSDRLFLVEAIWNSITSEKNSLGYIDLSDEQKRFLNEELADYELKPKEGLGWNELKSKIKLGREL